jgi:hypothetical protein
MSTRAVEMSSKSGEAKELANLINEKALTMKNRPLQGLKRASVLVGLLGADPR